MEEVFEILELKKIQETWQRRFQQDIQDELFEISGLFKGSVVVIKLILANADRSFYYEIEGAFDFANNPKIKRAEGKYKVLDLIDQYLIEFFESGREVNLHLDWKEYLVGDFTLHMKGEIRNLLVEDMANKLLNNTGKT